MSCPFGFSGPKPTWHDSAAEASSSSSSSSPSATTTGSTTTGTTSAGFGGCTAVDRSGGIDLDIYFSGVSEKVPVTNLPPALSLADLIDLLRVTRACPATSDLSAALHTPDEIEVIHKKTNSLLAHRTALAACCKSGDALLVRKKGQHDTSSSTSFRRVRFFIDHTRYDVLKAPFHASIKDLFLEALLQHALSIPACTLDELVFRYRGRNLDIHTAEVGSDLVDEDECLIAVYCFAQVPPSRVVQLGYYGAAAVVIVAAIFMYVLMHKRELLFPQP